MEILMTYQNSIKSIILN